MMPDGRSEAAAYHLLWCPTVVMAGSRYAASALRERIPPSVATLVVADPFVDDAARGILLGRDPVVETVSRADDETLRRVVDAARALRPGAIVAVGGGTAIDIAKLAASVCEEPTALDRLLRSVAGRGGVSTRRRLRTAGPRLFAVPTTIGTAAEVSPVACLTVPGGHRLIVGDDLRPDAAILDGAFLTTLGADAIGEGAMEALLRLVGAVVASDPDDRRIARAARTAARLTGLVDAARAGAEPARAELAVISSRTRCSWSSSTLRPFGVAHWYLANELAYATGARKIPATLPVVEVVWSRMLAGDRRFGDPESLRRFWRCWATASGFAASDPVGHLRDLIRAWSLPVARLQDGALERTVSGIRASWCAPAQALAGWSAQDLRGVLLDVLSRSEEWHNPADAGSAPGSRREVNI